MEKQIRNWITTSTKAKVKAVKNKRKQGAANEDTPSSASKAADKTNAAMFEALGLAMPTDREEQIAALVELRDQEGRYEALVQKAREAILQPDSIPLTRLQGDDEKSRNVRAKLMQEALEAAQKVESGANAEECEASRFGAMAALKDAQEKGGFANKDPKDPFQSDSHGTFVILHDV